MLSFQYIPSGWKIAFILCGVERESFGGKWFKACSRDTHTYQKWAWSNSGLDSVGGSPTSATWGLTNMRDSWHPDVLETFASLIHVLKIRFLRYPGPLQWFAQDRSGDVPFSCQGGTLTGDYFQLGERKITVCADAPWDSRCLTLAAPPPTIHLLATLHNFLSIRKKLVWIPHNYKEQNSSWLESDILKAASKRHGLTQTRGTEVFNEKGEVVQRKKYIFSIFSLFLDFSQNDFSVASLVNNRAHYNTGLGPCRQPR